MSPSNTYLKPTRIDNATGQTRRVGVELEFAGISPEETAGVVLETLGGETEKISEAEYVVAGTKHGAFRIELDWAFGKRLAKRRADNQLNSVKDDTDLVMKWMTSVAGQIVPTEIVCPPIAISELWHLDQLGIALKQSGAQGTAESVLYAFGQHLNPELPDLTAGTISRYLQAFVICQHWLLEMHQVDISRRISPYIEMYDNDYATVVLEYDVESVTHKQIIDDYLQFNLSRNRALDMLPVLKHINPGGIETALGDEKVNARPTFHYRLPNCEIGRPGWSVAESWNLWCLVEHLSYHDDTRSTFITQWNSIQPNLLGDPERPWHIELSKIYHDLLSE